jgi:hypothetical protein
MPPEWREKKPVTRTGKQLNQVCLQDKPDRQKRV